MSRDNCVSFQELSDYCLGTLDAQRADTVADHVEQCPRCDSTLRQFEAQGDAMFATLLRSAEDDPCLREPGLTRTFELAAAIVPAPVYGSTGGSATADRSPFIDEHLRDYQLLARLGQGGMGAVYKAVHTRLNKVVAVKLLPADRMRDPHAVARFQREMRAVGKLEHPNIVAAHDAGEADGRHYLVLEYVDGLDLAEVARRAGSLAVADACELARQAALGLDYAHHHGLIHRDIKPSNLMLTATGQVKILDLGLALLQGAPAGDGELTRLEQVMGTTDYMAPEQAGDSHGVGGSADIYSLGCTLYKLLSGVVPYGGPQFATPLKKLLAHVNAPVPNLTERRVGLPDGLAAVVERMMAKRPEERFATAADVSTALAPFAAGSDLAALFSAVRDKLAARQPVENGLRALPPLAPDEAPSAAASHSIDTDAHLSSAFSGTEGDLQPTPKIAPAMQPRESDASGRESSGHGRRGARGPRWFVAAAGAAAVVLLGVVIVVKMRDGSTRKFEVEGEVENVSVTPTDDADSTPMPADADRDVVKWVFEVGGRVAGVKKENWAWPSKLPESFSDLPNDFDGLIIDLAYCQKVTDADLKRFKSLTKPIWLSLYRTKITDAGLVELNGFTNVRILNLEQTSITRAGLQNLGILANLETIELSGTATAGVDLELLSNFPKLIRIGLGPTHLNLQGVNALSSMPRISVGLAGVGEAGVKYLGNLSHLQSLSTGGQEFNDACLEPLASMRDLTVLGLWDTSVGDAGIARLPSVAPRLTLLSVSYGRLTDDAVPHLQKLSKLRGLNLYETGITAAGVAKLRAALPDCEINWTERGGTPPVPAATGADREIVKWVLDVGGQISVGDGEVWQAATAIANPADLPDRFGSLTIGLSNCPKVTDSDLKRFKLLTKPFGLALGGTRVGDAGLAELHGLPNLRYLHLTATSVTRAGLDGLGALPNLYNIELNGTSTTDADLSLLARFPKLNNLAVGQAHLTERGVQVLSTLPNIVALYVDDAAEPEAERISNLRHLRTLSVGGQQFNDACLEPLSKLTNLISLGLYNTSVTDQGVARLPFVAPQLDYLNLAGAPVTDAVCKELAALTELKRLVLTECRIGDAGLESLSDLVGLDNVYLNETDITDAGLKHLHRLANLKLLDVSNTQITAVGIAELKAALPGCHVER